MTLRTLLEPHSVALDPIKGSRFIGVAEPVQSVDAFDAFRARIRAEHPSATHHCYAWRLSEGEYRSSDDGEPGGTAGRPILAVITGREFVWSAVIVVRYYGGVKLGAGGLVRAYGQAAAAVLDAAGSAPWEPMQTVEVRCSWQLEAPVRDVLRRQGVSVGEALYETGVCLVCELAESAVEPLREALVERTSGRATVALR